MVANPEVGAEVKRALYCADLALRGTRGLLAPLLLLTLLLSGGLFFPVSGEARAASVNYPPFNVQISGPSLLSSNSSGQFFATARGGPAQLVNGTYVGNYTFTTSLLGVDTSGSFVSPVSGAFIGEQVNLTVGGLVATGTYTFELNVTSHGVGAHTTNLTQIFSTQFQIVIPYVVSTTVKNLNSYQVNGAAIQVSLDGSVVGSLGVPSLLPSATTAVTYNYTTLGLAPGYHTFTLTLVGEGSLLQFGNGQTSYSVTFYVSGPPPSYTTDELTGLGLALIAIFISLLFFGPRRPRRKRSP